MARINCLVMSDILPFNFGMFYKDWLNLWENNPKFRDCLIGSDPNTWSQEQIDKVNEQAKEELELYDRLMALPDDEFHKEIKRLEQEQLEKL